MPPFRKASCRSRSASVRSENSSTVKISGSGLKWTVVPVPAAMPITASFWRVLPRTKDIWCRAPSRSTVTTSDSDSALTTDTPTPCRPPETL